MTLKEFLLSERLDDLKFLSLDEAIWDYLDEQIADITREDFDKIRSLLSEDIYYNKALYCVKGLLMQNFDLWIEHSESIALKCRDDASPAAIAEAIYEIAGMQEVNRVFAAIEYELNRL